MVVGIFGKKLGMTHIFDKDGSSVPVTLIKAEPCQISQIKTEEADGYNAVQIAYSEKKATRISKPISGHLEKAGLKGLAKFGEFRVDEPNDFNLGEAISVESFTVGQKIKITGQSIGKGFAGLQKRHNFSRGPMTHGSKNHRLPGSIGAGTTPGRVYPGKKMAGRLGNKVTTITNSEVLLIDIDENILVLKGSVPGKRKNMLKITPKI